MLIHSRNGSMMLMAFYVIVSLVAVSAAFAMMMVNDRLSMTHQLRGEQAQAIAEAGLERAIELLRADFRTGQNWSDSNIAGTHVEQQVDNYYEFIPVTVFGAGSYTVSLKNVLGKSDEIWIKTIGQIGDVTSTLQGYVAAVNPADWTVKMILWQKI